MKLVLQGSFAGLTNPSVEAHMRNDLIEQGRKAKKLVTGSLKVMVGGKPLTAQASYDPKKQVFTISD